MLMGFFLWIAQVPINEQCNAKAACCQRDTSQVSLTQFFGSCIVSLLISCRMGSLMLDVLLLLPSSKALH